MISKNQPLQSFLNQVAANSPVPGGGSVSALNAAIATSLTEMVANLTVNKKKYASVKDEMQTTINDMSHERSIFLENIDRDAEAYNLVFEAFKLSKETEEQKSTRSNQIQHATKQAAIIPMEVAQRALAIMNTIAYTTQNGNQNAVTDGCIAMMTCRTAVLGALLNVRINLSGIKDDQFVREFSEKCDWIEETAVQKEQDLIDWVKTKL